MTLYEMNTATRQLYELLQNEEIDEQTFNDTLESIGVEHKIDSYCEIIKQFQADAEMLKNEIDRLEKRKKSISNGIDRMKKTLSDHLGFRGERKVRTNLFTVYLQASEKLEVVDAAVVPRKYFIKQDPELDTATIKDLLKQGKKIKGCVLAINEGVRIR